LFSREAELAQRVIERIREARSASRNAKILALGPYHPEKDSLFPNARERLAKLDTLYYEFREMLGQGRFEQLMEALQL
jgi:hypothetical protein